MINVTRVRHQVPMRIVDQTLKDELPIGCHYIAMIYDGPEVIGRELSYRTSANEEDLKKILAALLQQLP